MISVSTNVPLDFMLHPVPVLNIYGNISPKKSFVHFFFFLQTVLKYNLKHLKKKERK